MQTLITIYILLTMGYSAMTALFYFVNKTGGTREKLFKVSVIMFILGGICLLLQ